MDIYFQGIDIFISNLSSTQSKKFCQSTSILGKNITWNVSKYLIQTM